MAIINKSHLRIGEFIIQATNTGAWHEKFIVLDEADNQIGHAHEHVVDAIEDALRFGNTPIEQ